MSFHDSWKIFINPIVPDCILSERSVILDPAFKKLRAGGVFQPRGGDELRYSEDGEARACDSHDLVEAARVMRQLGSHIIVGVTIGGQTTTTLDFSTSKIEEHKSSTHSESHTKALDDDPSNEDLISTKVQTLLRKARDRLAHSNSHNTAIGAMSDMAESQSIGEDSSLLSVLNNDPVRSMQMWEAELEENKVNVARHSFSNMAKPNSDSNDITDSDDPFNPFQSLAPPSLLKMSQKKAKSYGDRRRRLLQTETQENEIDYGDADILDAPRHVLGGTHVPRGAMDENDRDLSLFWQSVDSLPGIVSIRVRPLLDIINHPDVQKSCFVTWAQRKHGTLSDRLVKARKQFSLKMAPTASKQEIDKQKLAQKEAEKSAAKDYMAVSSLYTYIYAYSMSLHMQSY